MYTFTASLQPKLTFIRKTRKEMAVFCTVCKEVFCFERRDRSDIKYIIKKKKHESFQPIKEHNISLNENHLTLLG